MIFKIRFPGIECRGIFICMSAGAAGARQLQRALDRGGGCEVGEGGARAALLLSGASGIRAVLRGASTGGGVAGLLPLQLRFGVAIMLMLFTLTLIRGL